MPEKGKEVIASGYDTYGKKVTIARYQGEKYGFTCGLVDAWMPLPKAYKVVKKCCSDCKHHTNGEIHGVTPCGSCGDDKKNFEQK